MHKLSVAVLASGSSGNSAVVKFDDTNVLVDAGLSCRELDNRLSYFGLDPSEISAVLLTHEHTDHTRGVERFCSKHRRPLYATAGTLSILRPSGTDVKVLRAGEPLRVGSLLVNPFSVNHYAADPVAFSLCADGAKVAIASDLGSVTDEVVSNIAGSNLLFVEANYDDAMLMSGAYPDFLKRTIRSPRGHLSNDDAGVLCTSAITEATQAVVLVHLSKENNTPEKARHAVEESMRNLGRRVRLEVTEHGSKGGPFRLG
jgi:phosphoribosyl 1,2-cyclic phosphodiesterase